MKLYDMIMKFDEDILNDVPSEIRDCLKNEGIVLNKDKSTEIIDLEYIWEVTKKICMPYIDKIQCNSDKMKCYDFLEDVKYHSIINIFLSIKNINRTERKPKALLSRISDYYGICSKSFGDKEEARYKVYKSDLRDLYNNFTRKINQWKKERYMRDKESINLNSDFTFCFDNSLQLGKDEGLDITLDMGIFFGTIKNWKDSPYNNKNAYGMRFNRLKVFYEALENVIETKDNKIDKIISAYTIERLFNITFIFELASFLSEKFDDARKQLKLVEDLLDIIRIVSELQKLNSKNTNITKKILSIEIKSTMKKDDASLVMKFINKMKKTEVNEIIKTMLSVGKLIDIKEVLNTLSANRLLKIDNSKKNNNLDYINALLIKLEQILEQDMNGNKSLDEFLIFMSEVKPNITKVRTSIANDLSILTELVSLPMVFSRKKYIKNLNEVIKKYEAEDYLWSFKFRHRLYYISTFFIPLVSKVYYYLIYSSVKDENTNSIETLKCIENALEKYIIENEKIYDINQVTLSKEKGSIFDASDTSEGFQVNITEMIYNYPYDRDIVSEGDSAIKILEKLDSEESIMEEILRFKYNNDKYYLNFPYNVFYSVYYDKKNDKL